MWTSRSIKMTQNLRSPASLFTDNLSETARNKVAEMEQLLHPSLMSSHDIMVLIKEVS